MHSQIWPPCRQFTWLFAVGGLLKGTLLTWPWETVPQNTLVSWKKCKSNGATIDFDILFQIFCALPNMAPLQPIYWAFCKGRSVKGIIVIIWRTVPQILLGPEKTRLKSLSVTQLCKSHYNTTKLIPMEPQTDPKQTPSGPPMDPKQTPDGHLIDPWRTPKRIPKRTPNGPQQTPMNPPTNPQWNSNKCLKLFGNNNINPEKL